MIRESEYIDQIRTFSGTMPRVMGTRLDLIVCDVDNYEAHRIWDSICGDLEMLDGILDRFNPSSEVSEINASVPLNYVPVSNELSEILRLCERYSYMTEGLFDISYGSPNPFEFNEDSLLSLQGGMLDFGGFAKGYAVKRCKERLESAGMKNALLNFGNSTILGLGKHPFGESWSIDVVSPFSGKSISTILLKDCTLSTSGNTPKYESHIVNPKTGERKNGKGMVCVVSPDPLDAEILSTSASLANEAELAMLKNNFPNSTISIFNE